MRISETQFDDLKVRFKKYFNSVPTQLWFAGRKDAPAPARQVHAVQQMFSIDLSAVGGNSAPKHEDHIQFRNDRELRVAISRLDQWESQQKIAKKRECGINGLTLEELGLSVKTYNGLRNAGVTHVSQLSGVTEAELLHVKNFGRKSLNELKEVLTQAGFRLGGNSAEKSESTVPVGPQKEQLEESIARHGRENFFPFFIITEEGYGAGLNPLSLEFNDRVSGRANMRQVTLEEIEKEYGQVEAQVYTILKTNWPGENQKISVNNMMIWTKEFIIMFFVKDYYDGPEIIARNPPK